MKKNKYISAFLFGLLFLFAGCNQPVESKDVNPPAPVTDVKVTAEEGKISLTWTDSTDEDFYGVKIFTGRVENDETVFEKGILVLKGTQKYEVSALEDGKTYVFKLVSIDTSFNASDAVISDKAVFKIKITVEAKYVCPICHKEYDNEEDAAKCCLEKYNAEKADINEQIIPAGTYKIIHKRQSAVITTDYVIYETEENKNLTADTKTKDLIKTYSGFTFTSFSYDKDTLIFNYSRNVIEESFIKLNSGTVVTPISIPGSSFYYASESNPVTVKEFFIAKNELTYGKWQEVYSWATTHGYTFDNPGKLGGGASHTASENEPVTGVNFRDAIVWCNAASEVDGLTPVYYYEEAQKEIVKSTDKVDVAKENPNANGYRLPTEAEWEYAARGGDPAAECWNYAYSGSNDIDAIAWYTENSEAHTHQVGQKPANAAGVFDMTGNVWEWTWWPLDTSLLGDFKDYRFLRGGYWGDPADNSYIIWRSMLLYTAQGDVAGFRLARSVIE